MHPVPELPRACVGGAPLDDHEFATTRRRTSGDAVAFPPRAAAEDSLSSLEGKLTRVDHAQHRSLPQRSFRRFGRLAAPARTWNAPTSGFLATQPVTGAP